jgi:DNA repair exonuclease SbcCD ATPase subunit
MKIVRLTAENVKRLVAVEIQPAADGSMVIVAGRNAQGKTSVLDAIWLTLEAKAAKKTNVRPVRDGETSAYAEIELGGASGELVVRREWSGETSKLTVKSKQGASYPSPQKMLDDLVGSLSFDPLEFLRADAKAQRTQLLEVVDVGFDPDDFERKRKAVYDSRTEFNREVKRLTGALAELPHPPAGVEGITGSEPIDVSALSQRIIRAEHRRVRASQLIDKINELESELRFAREELSIMAESQEGIPTPEEVEELQKQLQGAQHHNDNLGQLRERKRIARELNAAQGESVRLTQKLEQAEAYKAQRIAAAKMPVEGLSFDEDGLTYQGVPLGQASGAEQLKVAVGVAMAANPKIRVIRIADGSLLDRDNLAALEQMAQEHDFQCWIERVGDDSPVAIVIEDGQVKS